MTISYANICWSADGVPRSALFDDVYYSAQDGRAETQHVFIEGNGLPQRWRGRKHFTIAETGFGSGLNFLHTWQVWQAQATAEDRLQYIAAERYPMHPDDIQKAMVLWPELQPYAAQLVAQYPLLIPGFHLLRFGHVELLLLWGDIADTLPELRAQVDAWYLDGFAPAKNAHMWQAELWEQMARLSNKGATVATFTAAGDVRRGLNSVGFSMQKTSGFGRKREMLMGTYEQAGASPAVNTATNHAIIIGAGIAGCSTARALAQRGMRITLLERGDGVAQGASGNKVGVLFPQPAKHWTPAARWSFMAYSYMLRMLPLWQQSWHETLYDTAGMLKLPKSAQEEQRFAPIAQHLGLDASVAQWLEQEEAEEKIGFALPGGGLWYPQGTWVRPTSLCAYFIAHPNITLHVHSEIDHVERCAKGWQVASGNHRWEAENLVLCNAAEVTRFTPAAALPLHKSRGQLSEIDAGGLRHSLASILCHEGYIVPAEQSYIIGATYDRDDNDSTVRAESHQRNIAQLQRYAPSLASDVIEVTGGRASYRAISKDRLPLIGELQGELYCSVGHGSRGLLSAPLGAELLAAQLSGAPYPVPVEIIDAVDSRRE